MITTTYKPTIEVNGVTYYHYELGGKHTSSESVIFNNVSYYNTYQ